MFRYDLKQNSTDSHQMSAAWALLFIRFDRDPTWDRATSKPNPVQANAEADSILVTHDCIEWNISNNKKNYISTAEFILTETNILYADQETGVGNGDWVLFWACDNQQDIDQVVDNIKHGKAANNIHSGLKFVGRVSSVFRNVVRGHEEGTRVIRYNINAVSFSELGLYVYYNPYIGIPFQNLVQKGIFQQFAITGGAKAIRQLLQNGGGVIREQDVLNFFVGNFLGEGPTAAFKQNGAGETTSPNTFYVLPNSVRKLLIPNNNIGSHTPTYADMLYTIVGVQSYEEKGSTWDLYTPSTTDLPGRFYVDTLKLDGINLWNLINQLVNAPMSEIYTTLRADDAGNILPTIIHRQMPFTSDAFNSSVTTTKYTSLPRWVLNDELVQGTHLGKEGSLRINYTHLIGAWADSSILVQNTAQLMGLIPPKMDAVDVQRYGPAPQIKNLHFISVLTGTMTAQEGSAKMDFGAMMMDAWVEGEKRIGGTILCKLIQEPIAVGDNLEYDNGLYHIESIQFRGRTETKTGVRTANTRFKVTYGTSLSSPKSPSHILFPNLDNNHSATYDSPGGEYLKVHKKT